jgi:4-aminobutyrate aminotransferase/(S)-3-amino-2-methylpropionate transaminase
MAELDLNAAARRLEEVAVPVLRELAAETGRIAEVRGRGAMLAVEFTEPGTLEPDKATTAAVAAACYRAGVVVLTCGTYGNVIRLLPPLVIGLDLFREGLGVLADAVRQV